MAVECARCKTLNSDSAKYCSECGNALNAAIETLKEIPDSILRDRVQAIIGQHYKDQKVVEIETTQAIATRLLDWSKLLAFFVGIPIALLFLILGVLGIRTNNDFSTQIDKAKKDVTAQLTAAQAVAAKLKSEGDSLAGEYGKLRAQVSDVAALGEQYKTLSKKVDVLGEKLGFTPTSKISPEARGRLETSFARFQDYVKDLGYRSTSDSLNIDVRERMEFGSIAYYDPDKRMMVIDSKYISDSPVIYREYMHHVLYSLGMPNVYETTIPTYYAIESGLAWYFPCSFVDNPKPSPTSTSWDLAKQRPFSEVRPDVSSSLMDGTEIWGSAFWELRKVLGKSAADKLLFDAWFKLRPEEVKTDRGVSFVRKLLDLDKTHEAQIRAVFVQRGLTF